MSKDADVKKAANTGGEPQFVPDTVMAPIINVSRTFLQKDRTGPQTIPFVRVGDKVLYHPPTVLAALHARTQGGGKRNRRGA